MPSVGRNIARGMDTRPWGSDAAYRRVQSLAGNVRDPIQGYRPRKHSEEPVSPSERKFENTLMDEGRFAKKGGFLVDQSRLLQELQNTTLPAAVQSP